MGIMDKIRVFLVDDHLILREGIRLLLSRAPDIEIVGEVGSGEEAVAAAGQVRPDVILMDITMPGMSGLEATSQIKQTNPDIKILVLTMHESDQYFFKMLDAGVSGYFVKGGSSSELVSAIRSVWRGDVFLYPTMAKKLLSDYLQRVKSGQSLESYDGLTNREREIIKLIAEDNNNQEIAERLVLSPATVQTHRANIMAKLGLHSRAELVKYAIKHGFITLDT